MPSQGYAGHRDKKNEDQTKIDPFGKLGEQLTWQNPVQRVQYRLSHVSMF